MARVSSWASNAQNDKWTLVFVNPDWAYQQGTPNPAQGYTLGFVMKIGADTIFADDRTLDSRLIHVLAHELGHALNMTHASEHNPGQAVYTCVENLSQNDSDFSDPDQLMWYADIKGMKQLHIGIQQLWQKNGNLGIKCH